MAAAAAAVFFLFPSVLLTHDFCLLFYVLLLLLLFNDMFFFAFCFLLCLYLEGFIHVHLVSPAMYALCRLCVDVLFVLLFFSFVFTSLMPSTHRYPSKYSRLTIDFFFCFSISFTKLEISIPPAGGVLRLCLILLLPFVTLM